MKSGLHIWHPFTQEALDPQPIRIAGAQGAYLYTADGRRLIDGISSWWVNIHGHCHPAIVSAIAEQAAKLDHVLLAGFTHEPVEDLCAGLRNVLPANLAHIFFSDNGSTAVEVALKIAIQYWKNIGRTEKRLIVALEHAYHGDTVGAMSVSDDSGFTDPFRDLLFPMQRVHSAYCYRCPVGKTRASCDIDCVDKLARLLESRQHEIAAVIVEPLLQGAGGMIVHPVEFLQRSPATVRRARCAADRGRSAHRLWALRQNVRLRIGGRRARLDVPLEGIDRRSLADGRDRLYEPDS